MRIKTGPSSRRKHKKLLTLAKGYRMTRHRLIKVATEAVLHAGEYAFAGRKNKKRDFRSSWIIQINAGLKQNEMSYSSFIAGLKRNNITIDRKMLADLANSDPQTFKQIVDKAKVTAN